MVTGRVLGLMKGKILSRLWHTWSSAVCTVQIRWITDNARSICKSKIENAGVEDKKSLQKLPIIVLNEYIIRCSLRIIISNNARNTWNRVL